MARSYTPLPRLGGESLRRFRAVLEVISGEATVSEAARRLGLSRNHFQSLMHRGLQALAAGLTPHPSGRPATPAKQRELLEQNQRLQHECERLRKRLETADRVLVMLRGFLGTRTRRQGENRGGPRAAEDE
jgi:transposase-like protein